MLLLQQCGLRLCTVLLQNFYIWMSSIWGAFTTSLRATIGFVMSVSLSVCSHGRTRLPLDRCSWNLVFMVFFSEKLWRKSKLHWKWTRITGTLHEDPYRLLIITRSVLLKMTNLTNIVHRKFKHILRSMIFIRKSCHLWHKKVRYSAPLYKHWGSVQAVRSTGGVKV